MNNKPTPEIKSAINPDKMNKKKREDVLYLKLIWNIKYLKQKANKTQQQLCTLMGCSRHTMGAWFEGRAYPTNTHLQKISDLFGITIDDLFKYDVKECNPEVLKSRYLTMKKILRIT